MPELLPHGPRRRVTWLDLLTVAVVAFAAMMPVLRTPYSPLDDLIMIQGNEAITQPTWAGFVSFWTEPSFRIYMPLALSVWQAISILTHQGTPGGPDFVLPVLGYKIVSVGTHALAAAAAAWALSTLTRTRWPAVVGGLVFALHPLQVESVAWTTGLKDELCGLFSIVAVGCYARHAGRNPPTPWGDVWWWLTLVAAVLAMLSKPTAMVLPVLLLAVDWSIRRTDVVRRFVSVAPVLLPAIACGLVIVSVQGNSATARVPAYLRPLVVADTYAFYLGKVVWPVQLTIDYGRRPAAILESGAIWWTWSVSLAVAVAVLLTRSRYWILAAALFVVPVLPVSGVTTFDMQQFSTVTDHYMYQSMFGVGLAAALLVRKWPTTAGTAAAIAVAVLAVLTYRNASRWEKVDQFFQEAMAINPRSWMARELLSTYTSDRGDLSNMRRLIDESLYHNPKSGGALDNKSILLMLLGRYRESAEVGIEAARLLTAERVQLARRITLIGARLNDPEISQKGLQYWLTIDPDNRSAAKLLRVVKTEIARRAATRPTTATAPALPPATTRP